MGIFSGWRSEKAEESRKRIYLDYAAATPVRNEIVRHMEQYYTDAFANPSAIHKEGREARSAVDASRRTIAGLLAVRPEEITFTSGGTEANNIALLGVVDAAIAGGARANDVEIISTAIEHPSILETLEVLKERGVTVHLAPVDPNGIISSEGLMELLSPRTLLVTFAYVNSEVGVVQDVRRIVRTLRSHNERKAVDTVPAQKIYVHVDASQAPLWLPCSLEQLGVDLMTLDAGKCYGPKGIGVLAHKRQVPLRAHLFGGGQERGLRPGTENVPLIVGCAEALSSAQRGQQDRSKRVTLLRDLLFDELKQQISDILYNGSRVNRVANNCNISIPGIDGEFAVVTLDIHGIACSTRSACCGGKGEKRIRGASQDLARSLFERSEEKYRQGVQHRYGGGSHVVAALTGDTERAHNTIRFTLGEETTKGDILRTVQVLSAHVAAVKHCTAQKAVD